MIRSMQGKTITDRAGATLWGGWVVWWMGRRRDGIPFALSLSKGRSPTVMVRQAHHERLGGSP